MLQRAWLRSLTPARPRRPRARLLLEGRASGARTGPRARRGRREPPGRRAPPGPRARRAYPRTCRQRATAAARWSSRPTPERRASTTAATPTTCTVTAGTRSSAGPRTRSRAGSSRGASRWRSSWPSGCRRPRSRMTDLTVTVQEGELRRGADGGTKAFTKNAIWKMPSRGMHARRRPARVLRHQDGPGRLPLPVHDHVHRERRSGERGRAADALRSTS